MTNLTNQAFLSLLRASAKVLAETAEQQRDVASQDLYDRLQDIEFQKVLDEINQIINNGSASQRDRLESVAELIFSLYPDPQDEDEEETVDGQDQITYGGATSVDQRPSTK